MVPWLPPSPPVYVCVALCTPVAGVRDILFAAMLAAMFLRPAVSLELPPTVPVPPAAVMAAPLRLAALGGWLPDSCRLAAGSGAGCPPRALLVVGCSVPGVWFPLLAPLLLRAPLLLPLLAARLLLLLPLLVALAAAALASAVLSPSGCGTCAPRGLRWGLWAYRWPVAPATKLTSQGEL